jgi:hypothetical protein
MDLSVVAKMVLDHEMKISLLRRLVLDQKTASGHPHRTFQQRAGWLPQRGAFT